MRKKLIKCVPGISGDLVGKKSKLFPRSGSVACRQLNLIHKKGPCFFLYNPFIDNSLERYLIKVFIGVFYRQFFRLKQIFFKKVLFFQKNFFNHIENIINRFLKDKKLFPCKMFLHGVLILCLLGFLKSFNPIPLLEHLC